LKQTTDDDIIVSVGVKLGSLDQPNNRSSINGSDTTGFNDSAVLGSYAA